MKLVSSAFANYGFIPSRYTCDGENISPPLQWEAVPEKTKCLVLICDDPDAPRGTWDHWIIFNLPVSTSSLPERINQFPPGTKLGRNSWGKENYGGPCPPDQKHRYFFRLYALEALLQLPSGATKAQIEQAMDKHIIEKAELVGIYARPGQKK